MRTALAAAALALFVGTGATGAYAKVPKPVLRLAGVAPLKITGAHFKPRERVRVTAIADAGRTVRTVRANRTGSFTALFARVMVREPCTIEARAVGGRGSLATLKLPERLCPVPLGPPPP